MHILLVKERTAHATIPSFGAEIIDQPNGYGPVNVYNNLPKSLSRLNADSYMYYACVSRHHLCSHPPFIFTDTLPGNLQHVFWQQTCGNPVGMEFQAPRAGTDDEDPDCNDQTCQN